MKYLFYTLLVLGLTLPASTYAQQTTALTNPLGTSDPRMLIARLIQGALSIMGSIALLMFMYGGFQWLASGGKSDAIKKGRDTILWAVLGIIVIASAFVLTNAIFSAVLTGDVAGGGA